MPAPNGIESFGDFIARVQRSSPSLLRSSKVRSAPALDEQTEHILKVYDGVDVQHSFLDSAGQVFDCVPFEQQPALRGQDAARISAPKPPALELASPPTVAPSPAAADRFGNSRACPTGTVPFRRITPEELARFETLEHYLRKTHRPPTRGVKRMQLDRSGISAKAQEAPHEYAHGFQRADNRGGYGILNVWAPQLGTDHIFSLAQHWYTADGPHGTQTVEVGWQVCPQMYGHSRPALFSYWTADDYQQTGSYSNTKGEFVQTSTTSAVGMALERASAPDGEQIEIVLCVYFEAGKWWLFLNGTDPEHALGYYPASQYGAGPLATHATMIDSGGETVGFSSFPPMGSGRFASAGFRQAAYHRNICFFDLAGASQRAQLAPSQDWPAAYTIGINAAGDWGEYFYFGGPGS